MRRSAEFDKLNEDQRQALDWTRSLCVRANAGSGKTSVLIQRIVQILHDDFETGEKRLHLDQIVAITFTRKAAAQLRRKLHDALTDCLRQSRDDGEQQYWQQRLDELSRCPIGTIDALCHRLLRTAVAEGMIDDLDPAFGIMQGIDRDELLDLAIVRTEQGIDRCDAETRVAWEHWLTTQGRKELGTALRLLLNSQHQPEECDAALNRFDTTVHDQVVLSLRLSALEETQRDFAGLRRQLQAVVQELQQLPAKDRKSKMITQLTEALSNLSRIERPDLNFIDQLKDALLTQKGQPRKVGLFVDEQPKSHALFALQQHWQAFLKDWKLDDSGSDGLDLVRQLVLMFREAHRHFGDLCREQNRYDFSGLARRLIDLLSNADAAGRLTGNFRFILVDEFQDTNELHWQIIARLAGGDPREPVSSARLMIVGDPQQSIYRFRKADPTVFDRVRTFIADGNRRQGRDKRPTAYDQHIDRSGDPGRRSTAEERVGHVRMRHNYRTTPEPLHLIDHLSKFACGQVAFAYQPLEAGLEEVNANAEVVYIVPEEPDSVEDKTDADKPAEGEAGAIALNPEQLELVAEQLRRLHDHFKWQEMAILLRSRTTLLTNLEVTLRQQGIPYQLVGGIGFWQRQEVRDMVSLARSLANAADDLSLFAALRGPLAGLDDSEVLFLSTLGNRRLFNGLRLLAATDDHLEPRSDIALTELSWVKGELDKSDRPWELLRQCWGILSAERKAVVRTAADRLGQGGTWRQRVDRLPHADLLRLALDESQAWAIYAAETEGEQRVANLRLFLDELHDLEADRPAGLAETARRLTIFVDEATKEEQAELAPAGGDSVQVMTVHAAKGLEFPVVAVVGLERQFRSDSPPILLLDRFQHLRPEHTDSDLGIKLHGLPVISFRDPAMPLTKISPLLHQALKAVETELGREEEARVFHVAITRAQKVLLLAGTPKAKEKCWQQWVHSALRLSEEFADGDWQVPGLEGARVRVVRKKASVAADETGGSTEGPAEFDLESIPESPRTRVIAATALVNSRKQLEEDPEGWRMFYLHRVKRWIGQIPAYLADSSELEHSTNVGRYAGTLIHRALEMRDTLRPHGKRRDDLLRAWATALVGGHSRDGDAEDTIDAPSGPQAATLAARAAANILQRLLSSTGELPRAFRELLEAPGESEVGFVLSLAGWQITGRFDRLLVGDSGAPEIVDWKTDDGSAPGIIERYREQMKLYALALYESLPEPRPAGTAVHLALMHHARTEKLHFDADELRRFRRELEVRLTPALQGVSG
jgi:ATP-dependent helicase/nuclease subunit A